MPGASVWFEVTEEQATDELFTYLVMNSDLKQIGDFVCSDVTEII